MTIQGVDTQSSANRAARAAQRYFSRRNTTYDRFSQPPAITSVVNRFSKVGLFMKQMAIDPI
jgi:hypothetical protein